VINPTIFSQEVFDRYIIDEMTSPPTLGIDCSPWHHKVKRPLENPDLFLEFAGLERTNDAVIAFAAKNGHLGLDQTRDPSYVNERVSGGGGWFREVGVMNDLVQRHQMFRDVLSGRLDTIEEVARLPNGDPEPGALELAKMYREEYDTLATVLTAVLESRRVHFFDHVEFDEETRRYSYTRCPHSLLGGIWLQFVDAVLGAVEFRHCEHCNKWFSFSVETSRREKLFCSNNCKFKDYRKRKTRALAMAAKGMSVEQIEAEIKASDGTVAKWILEKGDLD